MAEFFVCPVIEKLINTCSEYLEDRFRWQKGMKELDRLRENQLMVEAVAVYASNQALMRDQNPALNKWLWQLRDVIDEADDLLDEIEYMKRGEQLSRSRGKTKVRSATMSFLYETANKLRKVGQQAFKSDPNLKRIEEVVQKFDKVSTGVATFLHLVKDAKHEHQEQQLELYSARETGSLPTNDLIGRGEEKEYVMKWLRNPSNEYQASWYSNISLLCILGHGGMGKTTLLQHVNEDVKTEEFDLKMWVCVSNNFNVKQVIANMLNEGTCSGPLDALQRRLQSVVKSKKFLLVLDDIWDDDKIEQDKNKWENVLAPLAYGALGSKILVTTRMESVASMISGVMNKKNEILRLEGLKHDECLQLLKRYAFHGTEENLDAYHNLRSIAKKMIKKLSRSPLATRVIGSLLNSCLEETHWTRVLNYDIGRQNDILPILKLSYIFLPKVLQICLSFCCTFPYDYRLDKDDLVQMWIALDFIQSSNNQGETLKDVGERYFDFLVKKSLLDKFQEYGRTYYKLHDILHDMLRAISGQECFSIVNDEEYASRTPEIIRHLYVDTKNLGVLKDMEKFEKLRSLFLIYYNDEDADDFLGLLTKIFKALKSIRLLVIDAWRLKQIPEEIEHLIHLRYLNIIIQEDYPNQLPRSLSNLYHLQFFYYNHDTRRMAFLGIHEVGKLNSLQILNCFYVQNEDGYRFVELEHMNELSLLVINFGEDVKDARDACSAKLSDKKNLRDLSLVWLNNNINLRELEFIDFMMNADQENVLDNLKPHSSLEKLKIESFMGARCAIWMNEVNLFSNLEFIKITNCVRLQTLPPFWQLGGLKYLYLYNMPKVKGFDYELYGNEKVRVFPSLQVLHIKILQAMEDWFVAKAAAYDCLFPCLIELRLHDCPKLQELPALPPHLKKLDIYNIGWKGCNWLQGISNYCEISIRGSPNMLSLQGHQEVETTEKCRLIMSELIIDDPSLLLMEPLRRISSIRKLEIFNSDVISFPPETEQWFLQVSSSLHELSFQSLKFLQSLPFSFESFSSLKILCIQVVPQLQILLNIPISLEQLEIEKIKSLQCPPSLSFSSLKHLKLTSITQLELPNFPPSLCQLELSYLSNLHCLPSCPPSLSSLQKLHIHYLPKLQELPDLPPSLCQLELLNLSTMHCLPSFLHSLSSLQKLYIDYLPELQELPDLPPSLCHLELLNLSTLHCLPSCLPSLSSLQKIYIDYLPELQELPDLPPSLCQLKLLNLSTLHCLPSCLPSISSLQKLYINYLPELQELPDLPPSLCQLKLLNLSTLHCLPSCLPSISSLQKLYINYLPELQELPDLPPSLCQLKLLNLSILHSLPSCLPCLSSLQKLEIHMLHQLRELSNLPPSLCQLELSYLSNLHCLPSCLPNLSSLQKLHIKYLPELQELPDLPPSLCELELLDLFNLHCLPSCLSNLSSLQKLYINYLPELQELPDLPPSLCQLELLNLSTLHCLRSCLPSLSSLQKLEIYMLHQLRELPSLPPSLCKLELSYLSNLHCLPSYLHSLSSLQKLQIHYLPQLRELPDLPRSLCQLELLDLFNLHCLPSCLPSLSSLKKLYINYLPELQELPDLPPSLCQLELLNLSTLHCLPSCLLSLSSLRTLFISNLPELRELPDLPPSLCELFLLNVQCLPSCLPSLSFLQELVITNFHELQELPDLPPSLFFLYLSNLSNLHCLPSCFPSLSSLTNLQIFECCQLRELPDLPPSLKYLALTNCRPELNERYRRVTGCDWHKIANIHDVVIFP